MRGPTYLKDKKKILAGAPAFNLGGVELIELPPPGTLVTSKPISTGRYGVATCMSVWRTKMHIGVMVTKFALSASLFRLP